MKKHKCANCGTIYQGIMCPSCGSVVSIEIE